MFIPVDHSTLFKEDGKAKKAKPSSAEALPETTTETPQPPATKTPDAVKPSSEVTKPQAAKTQSAKPQQHSGNQSKKSTR
jgi:hypothetical protein